MTVLVTGSTGNVGREVVRALLAKKVAVRAAGSAVDRVVALFGSAVEAVALDFRNPETFAPAAAGCDAVFLLRPPPISDVKATLNAFIDSAAAQGMRQVVFLSVAGAENNTLIPHRGVEDHLQKAQVGWTLLRPGFFADNLGDAYRPDIVEDDRIYVPAGAGKVAFIDARDIAAVAVEALLAPQVHRGKAYWLTGPEAVSFDEAARLLSQELQRAVRYQAASIPGYGWHLKVHRGLPAAQVAVQLVLHVGLRSGGAEPVSPHVQELLGRPPLALGDYVRDRVALWRKST